MMGLSSDKDKNSFILCRKKNFLFDVMKLKHNNTPSRWPSAPALAGVERQLCSPETTWMELTRLYLPGLFGVCRSSEDHIRYTGYREPGLNQAGHGRPLCPGFAWRHCQVWAGDSEAVHLLLSLTEWAPVLVAFGRTPACRRSSHQRGEGAKDVWENRSDSVHKASKYLNVSVTASYNGLLCGYCHFVESLPCW